jgi:MSHA biogenesis protein MshQ
VGSFSSGIASASNLNWSEVGNGDLVATLTSGSYLGSTLTASGTTASTPGALYNNTCNAGGSAGNVGRFIPDHFETAILSALIPTTPIACPSGMTCAANAGGTNAPLASASLKVSNGMVYANQPFTVQVTAKNAAATPATTVNYQGSFAKATALSTSDSKGGAAAAPGGGTLSNTALAASAFAAGVGTTPVTTPNTTQPTYALGTTTTAPADIFIRATEAFGGDGVTSLLATAANSVEAGIKVANGRIKIPNAYGSEKIPLSMVFTVQYYNGSYWVTSVTDNALSFNSALSTAVPTPGNLTATKVFGVDNCISVNAPANAAVASGVRTVLLSATAACSYNISLSGTPSYLPISPATGGRATFGIYKSPLIYRRENY